MKFVLVFALVAAAAAQKPSDVDAPIVRSSYESDVNNFQFAYETGNGIAAQADGVVKNPDSDNPALEVKGSYRYTADDGTPVEVSYIANEDGYQPQGSHLPVPPPIPVAIQRSLEYIAAHPAEASAKVVTAPFRAGAAAAASVFGVFGHVTVEQRMSFLFNDFLDMLLIICSLSIVKSHLIFLLLKFVLVFALVAAAAAQKPSDVDAPIVRSSYESDVNNFQFAYETGNGIVAQADGVVKNPDSDNPALEVKGSYRYTADDGTPVEVSYIANEDGYQPQGSHLPVPPPIPVAIQRSLEYIAAHPAEASAKVVSSPINRSSPRHLAALLG
ncbi:hypothetical protein evm_003665 [Chilo suppressalis]|nr:hypothetical protein evm_003665 [Chilo suppressalis]